MDNEQLTTDQTINWIKEQSQALYPQFFQTDYNSSMFNVLANNSIAFIGNRKDTITTEQYKSVSLYATLMMMYWLDHMEGTPTSVKAGSLDVELQNGNNPFSQMLAMWLQMLGWDQWGCQLI